MKFCSLSNYRKINTTINILIHMTIMFTFLTIFFTMYAAHHVKQVFDEEISNEINGNLRAQMRNTPMAYRRYILAAKQTNLYDNMLAMYEQPDQVIETHNKWLVRVAFIICGALFTLTLAVIFTAAMTCSEVPLGKFLLENLLLFLFVGILEGAFFFFIALKFIPVPPSLLATTFINDLKNI